MTEFYEKIAVNLKDPIPLDSSLLSKVDDAKAMVKFISAKNLSLDQWRKLILAIYEADLSTMFQDVAQHFLKEEVDKKSGSKAEDEEKKLTLINTIAAYYLIQASKALEKSKRDELFGEVMRCTSKSDTINMLHSSLFVLKGYYLFYQGMFDQAVNYFDNGREYHSKKQCVTACIGQACVEFCKKDYPKALKLLKSAFRLNPKAPAKLKIALGYLFYTMNKSKLALKAFEYALESVENEPNNPEAYLGIAIVHKKKKDFNAYFENLEKSFNIKKDNVPVLLELAEHFYYKEDFGKAKKLGLHGLKLLNKSPTILMEKSKLMGLKVDYYEIKSRLNHIVASCYHQAQNYENALKHYNIAVNLYSNNFQAQFGLGQIHINDRNFPEALACFEYIVKNCTDVDVGECYRMLGYLYSKKSSKDEAIQYYEKAIKFDNKDYECMLEYASYLEPIDPDKALQLYLNAVKVIKAINAQSQESGQREIFLHPEILLNIAILRHKRGELDKAHDELKSLLETVDKYSEENTNEKSDKYKAMRHTIMYDLAIVLEEKGVIFEAIELYNQILEENSLYLDAYLRLSYLALTQGQKKRAEELCQQFMEKTDIVLKGTRNERVKGRFVDGLCLQGYTLSENGNYNKALRSYGAVRDKYVFDDPYAKLSQAAIYYNMSLDHRDNPTDQKKYLKTIIELAKNVLVAEEPNFFAAMVMGISLAETNRLAEAKDVFNLLLESCSHHKNIMLNLAYLEILNRRYEIAIATFNKYLKEKSTTCDPHTEMSLALCYLMTKRYKEAKRVVQKLVLKYPESLVYRYNLCAIYYEEAFEILKQEQRAIENTKEGVKYLKIIQSQFDYLMASNKSKLARLMLEETNERKGAKEKESDRIRELSSDKYYWITTNFDTFMDRLKHDEQMHKKKVEVTEEKKRRNFKEERDQQKQKEIELAKKKERELEEKARRIMEQAQEAQNTLSREREEKERQKRERMAKRDKDLMGGGGGGGKKKRRQKEYEGDGFIDEREDEEPEYQEDYELPDEDEEEPEAGDYGDGEGEGGEESERRRRKKEKKDRRNKLKKMVRDRGGDEGEEENEDLPIEYEETEEPKPQKKRKLQKLTKKREVNFDDEENMFNSGNEDMGEEEKKESEAGVEEEAGGNRSVEEAEEPAVEEEEGGDDQGGGDDERPKSQGDEEEHYM